MEVSTNFTDPSTSYHNNKTHNKTQMSKFQNIVPLWNQ